MLEWEGAGEGNARRPWAEVEMVMDSMVSIVVRFLVCRGSAGLTSCSRSACQRSFHLSLDERMRMCMRDVMSNSGDGILLPSEEYVLRAIRTYEDYE